MSYSKTTWVNQATPLSAANMNKIEDELVALDIGKINEPVSEGTNGQVLMTNGAGVRSWVTVSSDNTKLDKPTLISSGSEIALSDNTEYRLVDVTSLTLTYPEGNFECWLKITTATSGAIVITFPTSTYIGAAPIFAVGETWEISIKDAVIIAQKVGDGT